MSKAIENPATRYGWTTQDWRVPETSETVVHFDETEHAVAFAGIDTFDDSVTLGISKVDPEGHSGAPLVIGADVIEIGETGSVVRGASSKTEGPGLKGTAAGIPKVAATGKPKPMNVGAKCEIVVRTQNQLSEEIAIIHFVEKREARRDARRGEYSKECTMHAVGRVLIAARIEVANAEPGSQPGCKGRLDATFDCSSARPLCESAPAT